MMDFLSLICSRSLCQGDGFLFHGYFICTPVASRVFLHYARLISTVNTDSIFSQEYTAHVTCVFIDFRPVFLEIIGKEMLKFDRLRNRFPFLGGRFRLNFG